MTSDSHSLLVYQIASTNDYFNHIPLDPATNEIQFVRLRSELSQEGLIQCDIEHAQDWAGYTCLSYKWGGPHDQEAILIGGRRFNIRQNLLHFLEIARLSYNERKWWIDAIYIV
jgi:Heterokaryon incompatibility protein (HET)